LRPLSIARQRRFVAEYLACRNAKEAARRIGYSRGGAGKAGFMLLSKPAVVAALRAAGLETGADGTLLHRNGRGADGLNPRQRRFIAEYGRSRNAHDAALRAGYAPRSAHTLGSRQLRDKAVIAALHQAGIVIRYGQHPRDQLRKPRPPFAKKELTLQQQRFIEEYVACGNASEAARRVGWSKRHPGASAGRALRNPMIAAALAREREKLAARTRIDAARVVTEYAHIAFASIADLVDWGPEGVTLKPDAALTAARASAVLEISFGAGKEARRVRIKMPAKLKALEALGKHFGLFEKRPPPVRSPEAIKEAREKLRKRFLLLVDDGVKAQLAKNAAAAASPVAGPGAAQSMLYFPVSHGDAMVNDIAEHRAELQALCRRFHVRWLDLFGSAARGDFDSKRSDLDFLVEFDRAHPDALSLKTYLGLKDSLEALFGRAVDLVEPGAMRNPYLKASIEGSRERVFEA
jgi:phage terminase small subunit/predicted nucleotidyltransferase